MSLKLAAFVSDPSGRVRVVGLAVALDGTGIRIGACPHDSLFRSTQRTQRE